MRIDQALDLGHSAITIQEDVRQSCGLSKLYGVRQPATCFVVKSSRKAERSAALFLLLLPPCRSLERTTANTRSIPVRPAGRLEGEGLRTYHQLCILIQVLVRFTGSYRREYRPVQNPLSSNLNRRPC